MTGNVVIDAMAWAGGLMCLAIAVGIPLWIFVDLWIGKRASHRATKENIAARAAAKKAWADAAAAEKAAAAENVTPPQ